MRKMFSVTCVLMVATATVFARQLAELARTDAERRQHRNRPADHVERDGERRLEAAAAGLQRIDADHLGRSHLPERRDRLAIAASLELWAVDRTKPTVAWKRPIAGGNHIERKQNMSSPSPVTDGKRVWVMTGVGMLKSFDFAGTELWSRDIQTDYGRFGLNWGYASSPLLHENALYVQVLHGMKTDDPSYVLKIDAATGKTIWKVERPTIARQESPDSYTTPTMVRAGGRTEIIITGGDAVTAHDPATGKEYWRADILNPAEPGQLPHRRVAAHRRATSIIAPSRNNPLVALRPGGSGDVAGTHVAWTFQRGPDVPTPVSDGTYLYVVNETGVVYCLDVEDRRARLRPGAAAERLLQRVTDARRRQDLRDRRRRPASRRCSRPGPKFEILASNSLDDACSPYCLSTVAVSEGQLFIRIERESLGDRAEESQVDQDHRITCHT